MSTVLDKILARTREDLAMRKRVIPVAELQAHIKPSTDSFADALRADGMSLIAEFKPRSPSRGPISPDAQPELLAAIYGRYASAISVLCDQPFFGGGYPLLQRVRNATDLPLLAKDFVVDVYQVYEARAHGADAVLLMVCALEPNALAELLACARQLGMEALVETHDSDELEIALRAGARVIGVNSRDLRTLEIDLPKARALLAEVPEDRVRVAESGLSDREALDAIRSIADAALLGTALMSAPDPAARIEELGWSLR